MHSPPVVPKVEVECVKLSKDKVCEHTHSNVVLDLPVSLYINNRYFTTFFAIPSELEEMAIGFVLSEGLSKHMNDIASIEIKNTAIYVNLKGEVDYNKYRKIARYASCNSLTSYLETIGTPRVTSSYNVTINQIYDIIREMGRLSAQYRGTLAIHIAAIFENCKVRCIACDVNRHVTVDKVIGKAIRERVDFSRAILVTTGRQAADMIIKAGRMGIPITISLRGPLYSGIYVALKLGITIIALTRGKGLVVYTHPERIKC